MLEEGAPRPPVVLAPASMRQTLKRAHTPWTPTETPDFRILRCRNEPNTRQTSQECRRETNHGSKRKTGKLGKLGYHEPRANALYTSDQDGPTKLRDGRVYPTTHRHENYLAGEGFAPRHTELHPITRAILEGLGMSGIVKFEVECRPALSIPVRCLARSDERAFSVI